MNKAATVINNYSEIAITELRPILDLAFKTRTNLFLLGDPGLGKTENIGAFAADLGAGEAGGVCFVTMVASMLDRLDLAGLPFRTDKNTTEFALMTSVADATVELNPDGPATVFYLNEVNGAPDSVQPALLRFLNERAVSGYKLRDNVMIIADGNHAGTSRIAREMPEPSKRRFLWVHVRVDKGAWMDYSSAHGCDGRVMAFIEAHAQEGVLCDFRNGERGRTTYSCPASWSRLGKDLPYVLSELPTASIRQAWLDGQLGAGIGKQFGAFLEHQSKLPNIADFLASVAKDVEKVQLPTDLDTRFMLLGMIANLIREKRDVADISNALILIRFMFGKNMGEESIFFFRSIYSAATKETFIKSKEMGPTLKALKSKPDLLRAIVDGSLAMLP